ncbi:hypothetical protein CNMCM6936_003135 [Aspergillus lentulus]|nr:hypothetical protein CNMCM6936_003135 [Aspergillus lentulus]
MHVVLAPGKAASHIELQNIAVNLPLPQAIRPSIIVPLDTIPTTPNGKVNRKALAALPLPETNAASRANQSFTLAEAEFKIKDDTIICDEETKVPEHFVQYRCSEWGPCHPPIVREVLLTGSTSFIGKAILTSLLDSPTITKVHCIAVAPEQSSSLPSSD